MEFKIALHNCCPRGGKVQLETFLGRLKVKVTGANKGQNGHILSLSGPELVHLCMDFKNNFEQLLPLRRKNAF